MSLPIAVSLLFCLAATTVSAGSVPSPEPPPCRDIICQVEGGGTYVGYSQEGTRALAHIYPEGSSPKNPERWFEDVAVIDCPGNVPDDPDRVNCEWAVTYCELNRLGSSGPYSVIYRRIADSSGPSGAWSNVGPPATAPMCQQHLVNPPRSSPTR